MREGTRAKPGNQLVYYICIHLLDPHWTMPRGTGWGTCPAAISTSIYVLSITQPDKRM